MWRRSGQSFTVGESVQIEVLEARANRVKLGIVAPDDVQIIRKEARLTREENLAAALSVDRDMIDALLRRLPARAPGV
jgi:carbon storage regulator CsrA